MTISTNTCSNCNCETPCSVRREILKRVADLEGHFNENCLAHMQYVYGWIFNQNSQ